MEVPQNNHYRTIILIAIAICIIAVALHLNRKTNNQNPQQNKSVGVSSVPKKTSSIDASIILPEEKKVVITKPVVVQKDPNLITSESYLVGDLLTGKIYISKNPEQIFPIASLSKLFTALVATHVLNQASKITITQQMLDTYGDAGHLVKDERFTVGELLYPLLLESSNDTAEAYAQSFGYKVFIDSMNSYASEIGMTKTSFRDASGLSPSNISTSKDLFTLAQYLYKNEPNILEVTRQKEFSLATTTDHGSHHFLSINPFVFYKPFIGGKTGRTEEARESMVSMFSIEKNSQVYPVAVVLLRSDFGEREIDTEKILDLFMKNI